MISGGRVYVHGITGRLHCLDLATGRIIWQRDLKKELKAPDNFFGVVSSPLVHGDLLIQNVGAPGGANVVAFDKDTGHIVWATDGKWGASCASPMLGVQHGRTRLFVLAGGKTRPPTGGLIAIDPKNGAIDFRFPFRSKRYESVNGSSPVVGPDWVFLTVSYGVGCAGLSIKEAGGIEELYRLRRPGLQFQNAVLDSGHLYMIDGAGGRSGALVCMEPTTGKILSRTELGWRETLAIRGEETVAEMSVGEGSLLEADGKLLCLGDGGHLLVLEHSPKGAKVVARHWMFRARQSWTPPVISKGLLYLCQNTRESYGTEAARLLCYDLRGQ